jgi:protein-S-isoprenylcysteine O-methyltransferase Ste14
MDLGIAQYQMSNSWRIGIDEKNKTELVTKGIFYSRNPIFLGMIISILGIFLILPTCAYPFPYANHLYRIFKYKFD